MELIGWAKVRKTAPQLKLGEIKPQADAKTLEAIIANRYEVMAKYALELRAAVSTELDRVKQQGAKSASVAQLQAAKLWLHRDADRIPSDVLPQLASAMNDSPKLAKLVTMREELRQLWTRTNVSAEQLVVDLQAWCKKAESSGIVALEQFSMKLRAAHA
jgi:stearoyl-CoA desaturase (delta-9 desaturase)